MSLLLRLLYILYILMCNYCHITSIQNGLRNGIDKESQIHWNQQWFEGFRVGSRLIRSPGGGEVEVKGFFHHLGFEHDIVERQRLAVPWTMCAFVTYSHVVWFSHSFIHENKLFLGSSKLYRILQFAPGAWVALVFEWNFFIRSTNDHEAKHNIIWEGGKISFDNASTEVNATPFIYKTNWIGWHTKHEKSAGRGGTNLASASEYSAMFSTFVTSLAKLPRRKKFLHLAEARLAQIITPNYWLKTNRPYTTYMAPRILCMTSKILSQLRIAYPGWKEFFGSATGQFRWQYAFSRLSFLF